MTLFKVINVTENPGQCLKPQLFHLLIKKMQWKSVKNQWQTGVKKKQCKLVSTTRPNIFWLHFWWQNGNQLETKKFQGQKMSTCSATRASSETLIFSPSLLQKLNESWLWIKAHFFIISMLPVSTAGVCTCYSWINTFFGTVALTSIFFL